MRSTMSQRIAKHQAPAKLSSKSLLSVTILYFCIFVFMSFSISVYLYFCISVFLYFCISNVHLLSVTVFSSKFSSVFSSSSCTFVNISLKWFKLSVSKDLVMAFWHAMHCIAMMSDVDVMMVVMFALMSVLVLTMVMSMMVVNLQVMTNALSRSLVNFALGGRTVESATRKFLVSCCL